MESNSLNWVLLIIIFDESLSRYSVSEARLHSPSFKKWAVIDWEMENETQTIHWIRYSLAEYKYYGVQLALLTSLDSSTPSVASVALHPMLCSATSYVTSLISYLYSAWCIHLSLLSLSFIYLSSESAVVSAMGHHVLCQSEHPTSHLTADVWHPTRAQTVILVVVAPCMMYHCWVCHHC